MSTTTLPVTATKACGQCLHWKAKAGASGECRRHAPQTVAFQVDESVKFESRFPETQASDWCGDYTPKA